MRWFRRRRRGRAEWSGPAPRWLQPAYPATPASVELGFTDGSVVSIDADSAAARQMLAAADRLVTGDES